MKSKLKFKKASLNATDLMKGEDGERWIVFTHLNYQSVSFFFPVNKKCYNPQLLFELSRGLGKAVTFQIIVVVGTLFNWLFSEFP